MLDILDHHFTDHPTTAAANWKGLWDDEHA